MSDLKQLLAEVAEQVPAYPVKEPALAAARRRRQMRRLVPVAAGLALIAVIGVSLFVPRPEEPPAPGGASWLPDRIEKPSRAPTLPADRGVGRGSVVYSPCEKPTGPSCREYVIAKDGKHYLIPGSSDKWGNWDNTATLSPDGRWLGVTRKGEFRLRDLTGTRTYTVEGREMIGMAWSPDGRWLVVGPGGVGSKPKPIWRLDTRTGETQRIRAPFPFAGPLLIDVNRRGDVLLTVPNEHCRDAPQMCSPDTNRLNKVALVDPDRGEKPLWTRELAYDAVRDDEMATPVRLSPDGRSVMVALVKLVSDPEDPRSGVYVAGDLLSFDLATGDLERRYDTRDSVVTFETEAFEGGTSVTPKIHIKWKTLAYDSDGILLWGAKKEGPRDSSRVDSLIDVVDPHSGEQRTVTLAPGIWVIAVRGSTM